MSEAQQQEVNDIRRQPMEQSHIDIMHNGRRGQHTIRIPEASLKRILIAKATAVLKDLVPGEFLAFAARDIVDRNILGP